MHKKAYGFTIVELLIVIVVISILAAISIVAYTGIQQRASNTAIINAASQTLKAIQAYVAAENNYPLTSSTATASICITAVSGCAGGGGAFGTSGTFDTNMQKIGMLPGSVPISGPDRYGVSYHYDSTRTLSGSSRPAIVFYYLQGTNQQCGMPVTTIWGPAMSVSSSGYTDGNTGGSGKTTCIVSIAGPGV